MTRLYRKITGIALSLIPILTGAQRASAQVFTVSGNGTWESGIPSTTWTAPGASWNFSAQVSLAPVSPGTNQFDVAITNFTYRLNGATVRTSPTAIAFNSSAIGGGLLLDDFDGMSNGFVLALGVQLFAFQASGVTLLTGTFPAGNSRFDECQPPISASQPCNATAHYPVASGTITIASSCQTTLSIPEFGWKQYDTRWGLRPYDHSYSTGPFIASSTGHMQLIVGSSVYPINISTANNVVGLARAINGLNVGIKASPNGTILSVYNDSCIYGTNCYPLTDHLIRLCDGACTSTNNILFSKTMSAFGCSITALAMALKFAGISTVTPFTYLDPGTLNDFMSKDLLGISLGGQFDSAANVDWDATTALVAANSGVPFPQKFTFDSTGRGTSGADAYGTLDNSLCSNGLPIIVQVSRRGSSHFVLVTGEQGTATDGSQYLIADPGDTKTTLKDYGNQFSVVGAVTDPTSDLSKLIISIDDYANAMVVDAQGRRTGFDPATGTILKEIPSSFYSEEQTADDTGTGDTTGLTHVIGVLRPETGSYQVVVTGLKNWPYALSISPYSQDGSLQSPARMDGIAGSHSSTTYAIRYAAQPGTNSIITLQATFASTLADIANYVQLMYIDNQGIANSLSAKITAASQATGANRNSILNAFESEVNAQAGKQVSQAAVSVLLEDANSLIAQSQ